MQHPNLDDITRRPQRYWNVDGLPELIMGLLWLLWGGAWLFGETLPHDWRWTAFWMFTPAILALTGVGAVWITKKLKARVTFPRTGYVEWKPLGRGSSVATAAVAMLVAMVAVAALRGDGTLSGNPAMILGVILSLAFVVASLRQRAPHLLVLAGVAIALGLLLRGTAGGAASANWLFVGLGAASALVGALRLALFLKNHPRPSLETA